MLARCALYRQLGSVELAVGRTAMNILYDVKAAAAALSMGRTRLFREIKTGAIRPLRHHPKVLFHRDELERYAAALRDGAESEPKVGVGMDPLLFAQEDRSEL